MRLLLLSLLLVLAMCSAGNGAVTELSETVNPALDGNGSNTTGKDWRLTTYENFAEQNVMNTYFDDKVLSSVSYLSGVITLTFTDATTLALDISEVGVPIQDGDATGDVPRWNAVTGAWEPEAPSPIEISSDCSTYTTDGQICLETP